MKFECPYLLLLWFQPFESKGCHKPEILNFLPKPKFGQGKTASVARKVRKIFATFTPCKVKSFNKKLIDFNLLYICGTPASGARRYSKFLLKWFNLLIHNKSEKLKCITIRGSACMYVVGKKSRNYS